jgi:hypothetical protein
MGFHVEPDDVDELVELIKSSGLRNVSDEAADLNLPGVWVCTTGYTFKLAKGYVLNAELRLCTDDQNPRRARKALQKLLNQVLTVVSPSGPVVARTWLLPEHQPALVPGLQVPINVRVTPEE